MFIIEKIKAITANNAVSLISLLDINQPQSTNIFKSFVMSLKSLEFQSIIFLKKRKIFVLSLTDKKRSNFAVE